MTAPPTPPPQTPPPCTEGGEDQDRSLRCDRTPLAARTRPNVTAFEDFVRPLLGDACAVPPANTPLSQLTVGDFAVLAWLDDVQARHSLGPEAEADLLARWDTATLHDVHTLLFADADADARPTQPS